MIALIFSAALSAAGPNNYVGAESCKSCHPQAYRTWQQSAHARAPLTLSESERKEVRCTICHSPVADDATQRSEAELARVGSVQCESCHGGGRYYSPIYVMKDKVLARAVGLVDANEQTCKRCHDAESPGLNPFIFKEAWARISHGKE